MSRSRNTKQSQKPPKWFKIMQKKKRKAKEKSALRNDKEIPEFKKTDTWDWN